MIDVMGGGCWRSVGPLDAAYECVFPSLLLPLNVGFLGGQQWHFEQVQYPGIISFLCIILLRLIDDLIW